MPHTLRDETTLVPDSATPIAGSRVHRSLPSGVGQHLVLQELGVVPDRRGTVTSLDAAAGAREALCEDHAGLSWVSMEGTEGVREWCGPGPGP